jgi:WD40 repeat protein
MRTLKSKTFLRLGVAIGSIAVGVLAVLILGLVPRPVTPFYTLTIKTGVIHALAIDPAHQLIAVGTSGAVQVRDLRQKALVWSKEFNAVVDAVNFSSDSSILAVGTSATVYLFNTQTFECVATLECGGHVSCLAMGKGKPLLCVGCIGDGLQLFKLGSHKIVDQWSPLSGGIASVEFSEDDSQIAVGTFSGGVAVYDVGSRSVLFGKSMIKANGVATFGPERNQVVVGDTHEKALIFVNFRDDTEVKRVECDIGHINVVKSSSDRKYLVAAGGVARMFWQPAGIIKVWSMADGLCVFDSRSQGRRIYAAAFCCNDERLVTGNVDGQIEFWNMK